MMHHQAVLPENAVVQLAARPAVGKQQQEWTSDNALLIYLAANDDASSLFEIRLELPPDFLQEEHQLQ
jgi:hypothetical protein